MHRRYREQDRKRSPRHTRHDPESGYTALLYQELARNDAPGLDDAGRLPAVLGRWVREVAESFAPPGEALGAELTLEEVEMTVVERAREWSRQLIREGREQGIEQGLAHERALLRRMAALRFGAATAERLEEALAGVADPGRLSEVGEWLVRCETGDEFLARATAARTESGPSKH